MTRLTVSEILFDLKPFKVIPVTFLPPLENTCLCCKYEWRVAVVVCEVWIEVLDVVQEL